VTGEGESAACPDRRKNFRPALPQVALTANAALAENARQDDIGLCALSRIGVPQREMKTSNSRFRRIFHLNNQNNTGPQKIVGYQVSNQLDVTLDDVKTLGPALDALVAAGAKPDQRDSAFRFAIRKPARERARTSRRRWPSGARRPTPSAGSRSVRFFRVQTCDETPRPVYFAAKLAAAHRHADGGGEQSVTASVRSCSRSSRPPIERTPPDNRARPISVSSLRAGRRRTITANHKHLRFYLPGPLETLNSVTRDAR